MKQCPVCNKVFLPKWYSQKYCSTECQLEGRRLQDRQRQLRHRVKLRKFEENVGLRHMQQGSFGAPMYDHRPVRTMYADESLYSGRDGRRHVKSSYHLLEDTIKRLMKNDGWDPRILHSLIEELKLRRPSDKS